VTLHGPDGLPLRFTRGDAGTSWVAPRGLAEIPGLDPSDLEVGDEPDRTTITIMARHRATRVVYHREFPFELSRSGGERHTIASIELSLDLATLAAGGPLPNGTWDLLVRVDCCGWRGSRPLPGLAISPDATTGLPTRPYVTQAGNVALVVEGSTAPELTGPPPPPEPIVPPLTGRERWRRARRRLPSGVRRIGRDVLDRLSGR
jgi:hypothetical protein